SCLSGSPWLIGIWRLRPFVRMVGRCAAPPTTASPSARAKATANRIHPANARVGRMRGSYNDFAYRSRTARTAAGVKTPRALSPRATDDPQVTRSSVRARVVNDVDELSAGSFRDTRLGDAGECARAPRVRSEPSRRDEVCPAPFPSTLMSGGPNPLNANKIR